MKEMHGFVLFKTGCQLTYIRSVAMRMWTQDSSRGSLGDDEEQEEKAR